MKKISKKSMVLLLFALCWLVYFASYLGRLNYSAAMAQLLGEGVLQKTQAGLISTLFFVCYASGQLVNGFLGDKFKPKTMLAAGMGISALMNLAMGLGGPFPFMALVWAVNGYAQSMIWPPIVYLFTAMLRRETVVRCFTNLASTIACGTLVSYFLSAVLLEHSGWHMVFFVPALIIAAVGVLFLLLFPKVEQHRVQRGELEEPLEAAGQTGEKAPLKKLLLSPAILVLILPVFVHGVLKDGLTAWVPTYISETFGAGAVTAVLVSMVLPVFNLAGAYMAGFVRKKIPGELRSSGVFFLVACLCLGVLWLLGGGSLLLSLAMLAVSSACMLAANTIFISYIPVRYAACGRSAGISGFLNATAYAGASASSVGIGFLAEGLGWGAAMGCFVLLTAGAFAVCMLQKQQPGA